VLCSRSAQFVLRHDGRGVYRLLAAQTPLGHALYVHYGLDPQDYESMILIADGVAWLRSEAVIRIAEGLGPPWSLAAVARVLPRVWRDRMYGALARNRFRVFGRRDTCYLPDPRHADRFLA
jgi:predicted DCC family thiol-disulfide oxidoreductase YuxK